MLGRLHICNFPLSHLLCYSHIGFLFIIPQILTPQPHCHQRAFHLPLLPSWRCSHKKCTGNHITFTAFLEHHHLSKHTWCRPCPDTPKHPASALLILFLPSDYYLLVGVQSPSHVWLFATPWTVAHQASLSLTTPSPKVCPSSCQLHGHPAISSSDALFSFCPQFFSASGTFPMSQPLALGEQNTGVSVLASVLSTNIQDWIPLKWTGLIFLLPKGLSGVFSSTTIQWHQIFGALPSLQSSSHNRMWPLGRPDPWLIWTFVDRVLSLFFNTLSRFVIAFLSRSNRLLISWLQSPSTVILEPKKRKSVTMSNFSLIFAMKLWGQMP